MRDFLGYFLDSKSSRARHLREVRVDFCIHSTTDMATLSLKVYILGAENKVIADTTLKFDPSTEVIDACMTVNRQVPQNVQINAQDYGLFLPDDDEKKGIWLDPSRNLDYYMLRNGDDIHYRCKIRLLRVRMLDGSVKCLKVNDTLTVQNLMVPICTKIGIANHDEYSLVRELKDEELDKFMSLRKGQSIARDQEKLDKMKKKLQTEDEVPWLESDQTLREQGVGDNETLLLKRKLFFSDRNIDVRDPIQLNLLYVQTRDSIIKSAHPVTAEQALRFGGLQCQIQFGDSIAEKPSRSGSSLKDFLPKEYVKAKNADKKVFAEHKKARGLTELEAKCKYVQEARSLKTYGVTFFLVKEKQKGKNKLRPILIGVTRDAVLRMDGKTKEMIESWPLEHVKNYARTPHGFMLDFGDYADPYIVQTQEGEKIANLINGYINIIIRKKKDGDYAGDDSDVSVVIAEDEVAPSSATIIQQNSTQQHTDLSSVAKPVVIGSAQQLQSAQHGQLAGAQHQTEHRRVHISNFGVADGEYDDENVVTTAAQRALLGTINLGLRAVQDARQQLGQRAEIPQIGNDKASLAWKREELEMSKQKIHASMSAISAATARILRAYSERPRDDSKLGEAINTILSNVRMMSSGAQSIAALNDNQEKGDKLLSAAQNLADAFTDLLKIAQPGTDEPRQNVVEATSRIGESTTDVLKYSEVHHLEAYEDTLMNIAKAVANATSNLVLRAKEVSNSTKDQNSRDTIVKNATQCALAASDLVACTKVLAPTMHSPQCAKQLEISTSRVGDHVITLTDCSKRCNDVDEHKLAELNEAGVDVIRTLHDLMNHIQGASADGGEDETDTVETILNASEKLHESVGRNQNETLRQAQLLAKATSQLVTALKTDAEADNNGDEQRKLLGAAKQLADATARMVEAAKGCALNPENNEHQRKLRTAAEDVRTATTVANIGVSKRSLRRLEIAARNAADSLAQLCNAARVSSRSQSNASVHQALARQCSIVSKSSIPDVVKALQQTALSPSNDYPLINSSRLLLEEGNNLVDCANSSVPTITNESSALSLTGAASALSQALAELQAALTAHTGLPRLVSDEIQAALNTLYSLRSDLQGTKIAASQSALRPLPRENDEEANELLADASKAVASSIAQLLSAASQNNESHVGSSARDSVAELSRFCRAAREVAATAPDRQTCDEMLDKALIILQETCQLLEEAKNGSKIDRLKLAAGNVHHALEDCVNSLPGLRDVQTALEQVCVIEKRLTGRKVTRSKVQTAELQKQLDSSANTLNKAASDVVSSARYAPTKDLPNSAKRFSAAYEGLANAGIMVAGTVDDAEHQRDIIAGIRGVGNTSSRLLQAGRSVMTRPNAPNIKNQLMQAARAVTESVSGLITTVRQSAAHPGQQECDAALSRLNMARNLLDSPSEPLKDTTYFECLDHIMREYASALCSYMSSVPKTANGREAENFCAAIRGVAGTICSITELAAHSAYILAVSDPSSTPGKRGIIDQAHLSRSAYSIQQACELLCSPARVTQQQILTAATDVAKHTSTVCTLCREASERTSDPVAKRHFVQSAKDVANATASLVKAIKKLDAKATKENRDLCANAAEPLIRSVSQLMTYADSPLFTSRSAKISKNAETVQKPIITAASSLLDEACYLVVAAKELAVTELKSEMFQPYSNQSSKVSNSLKDLMTSMKDSAPGQVESAMAIDAICGALRQLDAYSVSNAERPRLGSRSKNDELMLRTTKVLSDKVRSTAIAGHNHPEQIGHELAAVADLVRSLVQACTTVSAKSSKEYYQLMEETKTVVESTLQLAQTVKECGGNANAPLEFHEAIDDSAKNLNESITDLMDTLQNTASSYGHVSSLIEQIAKAISRTEEPLAVGENISFAQFQTSMVHLVQAIVRSAHDMNAKTVNGNVQDLGGLVHSITRDFTALAQESRGAVATSSSQQNAISLRSAIQQLGTACIDLVQAGGNVTAHTSDQLAKNELSKHVRVVAERVGRVLRELRVGARGTEACIHAASTVSGLIADLDTTIMFATAGTLAPDKGGETFKTERDAILRTARMLVDDTKLLVGSVGGEQQQLADAARAAVTTISKLADCVKRGAAALGADQPEAQALLLHAIKDVATALSELVSATKQAVGRNENTQSVGYLKDSAKQMIENITQLLKTVKTVENKAARGTRALEATQAAIETELRNFASAQHVEQRISPDQLIRLTRPITSATAKAVAAGNSGLQSDVIEAANAGRKAIIDVLKGAKGAANSASDSESRERALRAAKNCAESYHKLLTVLDVVLQQPGVIEPRKQLAETSKRVASSITEIVTAAETIQGPDDRRMALSGFS
ncbi:DgyrCDS11268 [Dimorphilus gyrociliatus]|uniref:DgyrCDS11268 n=1 Tax=Dimorphilus gyrociliatus TaxID=2664684 RepID=A0A7I8W3U1_9ANNE|nr:DgyrCDS11268 [Dimorphilus gyrociliatus]